MAASCAPGVLAMARACWLPHAPQPTSPKWTGDLEFILAAQYAEPAGKGDMFLCLFQSIMTGKALQQLGVQVAGLPVVPRVLLLDDSSRSLAPANLVKGDLRNGQIHPCGLDKNLRVGLPEKTAWSY